METTKNNGCKFCGKEITWGKDPQFDKWVMLEWSTPCFLLEKVEGGENKAIWAKGYKAKHLCPLAPQRDKSEQGDSEIPF